MAVALSPSWPVLPDNCSLGQGGRGLATPDRWTAGGTDPLPGPMPCAAVRGPGIQGAASPRGGASILQLRKKLSAGGRRRA